MRWDEMGWSMKEIDELHELHNYNKMSKIITIYHNEILQNQTKVLQRLHLAAFGFPLKDLKSSMMHSGFCPLQRTPQQRRRRSSMLTGSAFWVCKRA